MPTTMVYKISAIIASLVMVECVYLRQQKLGAANSADILSNILTQGDAFLALDRDMHTEMLVQVKANRSASHQSPCMDMPCPKLSCPAGFQPTNLEGSCCPYCLNPKIKIKTEVTGADSSTGGKMSAFCPDVWCFPKRCPEPEIAPTTKNGQCCFVCPIKVKEEVLGASRHVAG